jgi:beta-phosphoglucomutase-like phosphatase (HAD superfamily)
MNFEAVIFDMDGVITKTAVAHSLAWKKMFDEYLHFREKQYNKPFTEFTHANDYLPYVDGRPRYKGVETFLLSRGIHIPFGTPDDEPQKETICGLGNRKNEFFNRVLDEEGVEVYESTIKLINDLLANSIKGRGHLEQKLHPHFGKSGYYAPFCNPRRWHSIGRNGTERQTRTRYFHHGLR